MDELNKNGFGGDIRGKFRGFKENEKVQKVRSDISAQSESIDKNFNFPKMLTGLALSGIAIGAKIVLPIIPFMDVLFVTGVGALIGGLGFGIKLDRVKKGGKFWKNEIDFFNKLTKGK